MMSNFAYAINVVIIFALTEPHLVQAADKTCVASYYRRQPCGYKHVPQAECLRRGCCHDFESLPGIPKCYKPVKANTVEKCFASDFGRKACGYRYISQYECKRRGCCFQFSYKLGVPSCYKPAIYSINPTLPVVRPIPTTTPPPTTRQPAVDDPPHIRSSRGEEESENDVPEVGERSLSSLLNMFLQMDGWQNATKSCDVGSSSRNDCGHPGITKVSCENKGCCWDNSILNAHWCFYPVWKSTVTNENRATNTGETDEQTTIQPPDAATMLYEPPIPTTVYRDAWETTKDDASSYEVTWPQYTSSTTSNPPTRRPLDTTTPEMVPPYEDPEDPPVKDDEFEYSQQNNHYIQREPSTTSTTTLIPSTVQSNKNKGWPSNHYMLSLFNYYSVYQKAKSSKTNHIPSMQTCTGVKSPCCRSNPTSPCCEFSSPYSARARSSNPNQRIVGGGLAGHLRSSVAYLTVENYASQFCGGTLIATNWVVTAAHCVLQYCARKKPVSEILVKLGKIDKANSVVGSTEQKISAKQVICHSHNCKYAKQPRLNDIALIKLARHVKRTMYVSPAALPAHGETPATDRRCIVLGWGETRGIGPENVLKEVFVPLYSNEQCNRPDWRGCLIRACMMCAGELNMDACEGDSGGPLFCERSEGHYVLHGVYSWGRCGAESKKPAVYTRFSYYVNWIKKQIYTKRSTR